MTHTYQIVCSKETASCFVLLIECMTDIINTWIELAKGGDREAFRRLLEEHYDMILRVAWRWTGNRCDAEDIAQEICIQLAGKLSSFRGDCQFKSWLYRVVVNSCKDSFKGRAAREKREQSYYEIAESLRAESADTAKSLRWLYLQIAALNDDLRDTAMLVLAEDLSHREAAEILECAESTISWRMHEIRKILKSAWEQQHE